MIKIENVPIVRFNMPYDSGSMIEFEMIDKPIRIGSVIALNYHNTWNAFFQLAGIRGDSYIELKRKKYNKFIWDVMINQENIENYFKKDKEFLEDNKIIEEYINLTFKAVDPYALRNIQYFIVPTLHSSKCCFENSKKLKKEEKKISYHDYLEALNRRDFIAPLETYATAAQGTTNAPALQDNAANGNRFYETITPAGEPQRITYHATPSPNDWQRTYEWHIPDGWTTSFR